MPSLCERCAHLREVRTPRGSRFLLCLLSQTDPRFPRYPPQPVVRCAGYREKGDAAGDPGPSTRAAGDRPSPD
jgi:hypothetical protein